MKKLIRLTTSLAAIAAAAGVEKKVLALANAMPESVYACRSRRSRVER